MVQDVGRPALATGANTLSLGSRPLVPGAGPTPHSAPSMGPIFPPLTSLLRPTYDCSLGPLPVLVAGVVGIEFVLYMDTAPELSSLREGLV